MIERPYIVCDHCGHTWESPHEEPRTCEACNHAALWAFPNLTAAEDHSQFVVDGRERALSGAGLP